MHKRQPRQPRKNTSHHDAKDKVHTTVNEGENSASAQQAEPPCKPKRRGRTSQAARATTSPSHDHTSSSAPGDTPVPNQSKVNHPLKATGESHNKSTGDKEKGPEETHTAVLRKEAYIPPHLRKRTSVPPHLRKHTSANGVKAKPESGAGVANVSPASSDMSKSTVPTKPGLVP